MSGTLRFQVLELAAKDLFVFDWHELGKPWPDLVLTADEHLKVPVLIDEGVLGGGTLIDGIPAPDLVHEFSLLG
jgi:hypothetical protein